MTDGLTDQALCLVAADLDNALTACSCSVVCVPRQTAFDRAQDGNLIVMRGLVSPSLVLSHQLWAACRPATLQCRLHWYHHLWHPLSSQCLSLLLCVSSTAALDAICALARYHLEQLTQLLVALAGLGISSISVLSLPADICNTSISSNSRSWPPSPEVLSCTNQVLQPDCVPSALQAHTRQCLSDICSNPQNVAEPSARSMWLS